MIINVNGTGVDSDSIDFVKENLNGTATVYYWNEQKTLVTRTVMGEDAKAILKWHETGIYDEPTTERTER